MMLQHIIVALATLASYTYGFMHLSWYFVLLLSIVYFIVAALIITTVQLGIFIDGKPQFGISQVYKYLPLLTLGIVLISVMMWI